MRLRPVYLLAGLLLFAGSALSVWLYHVSQAQEHRRLAEEFEVAARNRVTSFRRVVEASVQTLSSLCSFHEASREVERQEFRRFVEPLLEQNPGIQALEWVPRVPGEQRGAFEAAVRDEGHAGFEITRRELSGRMVRADSREEHFPVAYVEPYRGNENAFGFDLASDPARLAAILAAREQRRPTASPRVRLVQGSGQQYGFLLFWPVHSETRSADGHPGRDELEGFALGVFRVSHLLESSLAQLDPREIEYCVLDRSAPEGTQYLYSAPANSRPPREEAPGELRYSETIDVGDRTWEVTCVPAAGYGSLHTHASQWWILAGGVLCSGLLSGCVLLILVRFDRARRHAEEILEAKNVLEREVAERRIAQERVKLLTTAIEQSSEGICVVDLEGRVLFVNHAFAAMHGYAVGELSGRNLSVFHAPEHMYLVEEANRQILDTGEFSGEVPHLRRDGTEFPGRMHNSLLHDESGEPVAMVGTLRDATQDKRLEEELRKAEKLESTGQLAGGIAHDFNNLLTGILGNINLSRANSAEGSTAHQRLVEAEKACRRAQDLTQQLLTFSSGGSPIKETVSIGELVRETVVFALRGSKVSCEFEIRDDLWPAEADEGQMSRVIGNIVINAHQAMPEGGVVTVRGENLAIDAPDSIPLEPGRYVRISLKDTGTGILPQDLGKIFDPYFTTKPRGSGLGLAGAYSIVRNHGGLITVESETGQGTEFHVHLPASDEPVPIHASVRSETKCTGARILVMDDEETVRDVANEMLTGLGCEVLLSSDGVEAVSLYRAEKEAGRRIDLVIMDLTVPGGMGGREALDLLTELDADVRAIVSSGYSNDPVMASFREHGFLGAVRKPYTILELSAALDVALSA